MSLESATYINDLDSNNPVVGDLVGQGDDHLRLIKAVIKACFPGGSKAFRFPTTAAEATGTVNVTFPDDQNKLFPVSASAASRTVNLPDPTSGATVNEDGFAVLVVKTDSSANTVTIDGSGAQTINGATTLVLTAQYSFAWLIWAGSDDEWYALTGDFIALTKLLISSATALTAPAADDELPVYDLSATTNKKITLENFFKVIAVITALATTNVAIDDIMVLSDTSDSAAAKAATIQVLFNALNKLTAETTIDPAADYLAMFDASGSATDKILVGLLTPARAYDDYALIGSITDVIPLDDTIPQITEGAEILSAAITLKRSNSRVRARFQGWGSAFSGGDDYSSWAAALFISTGADALQAVFGPWTNTDENVSNAFQAVIEFEHAPGAVGPHTYSVRVGPATASSRTLFMNAVNGARIFGGTAMSTLVLEEVFV